MTPEDEDRARTVADAVEREMALPVNQRRTGRDSIVGHAREALRAVRREEREAIVAFLRRAGGRCAFMQRVDATILSMTVLGMAGGIEAGRHLDEKDAIRRGDPA